MVKICLFSLLTISRSLSILPRTYTKPAPMARTMAWTSHDPIQPLPTAQTSTPPPTPIPSPRRQQIRKSRQRILDARSPPLPCYRKLQTPLGPQLMIPPASEQQKHMSVHHPSIQPVMSPATASTYAMQPSPLSSRPRPKLVTNYPPRSSSQNFIFPRMARASRSAVASGRSIRKKVMTRTAWCRG